MTITRGSNKEIDYIIEHAYRRGYHQGFDAAVNTPKKKHKEGGIKIYQWRKSINKNDPFFPPPGSGFGDPL